MKKHNKVNPVGISNGVNRRNFLKLSLTSVAAFTIVPRHVLGGNGFLAPSDQLTKAVIGVGDMGRSLEFDPVKQRFVDDEGTNRFIDQPKRAPWI